MVILHTVITVLTILLPIKQQCTTKQLTIKQQCIVLHIVLTVILIKHRCTHPKPLHSYKHQCIWVLRQEL